MAKVAAMNQSATTLAAMSLCAAVLGSGPGLRAEAEPQTQSADTAHTPSRLRDIRVRASGRRFEALILFDTQPNSAQVELRPHGIVMTVHGVTIPPMALNPPDQQLIYGVRAAGENNRSVIELSGALLNAVDAKVYRNSVLIFGELTSPRPELPAPLAPVAPTAPSAPKAPVAPAPYSPSFAVTTPPHSASHNVSIAQTLGFSEQTCADALNQMEANPWDLQALGDHLLCEVSSDPETNIDADLEQLRSFSPDDWRAELASAEQSRHLGDQSQAVIAYRNAIALCDDPSVRTRLEKRLSHYSANL